MLWKFCFLANDNAFISDLQTGCTSRHNKLTDKYLIDTDLQTGCTSRHKKLTDKYLIDSNLQTGCRYFYFIQLSIYLLVSCVYLYNQSKKLTDKYLIDTDLQTGCTSRHKKLSDK
jgi:hypothetical protein